MAFDIELAQRLRTYLAGRPEITEKKMFGGLAFLHHGNMLCGIVGTDLMVRVGKEHHDAAMELPHVRPMDFTGRPMRGFVYVEPRGFDTDEQLAKWVERAQGFVDTLPPK